MKIVFKVNITPNVYISFNPFRYWTFVVPPVTQYALQVSSDEYQVHMLTDTLNLCKMAFVRS